MVGLEKTSILIIDDSRQKITMLESILSKLDIAIISVTSGTDGLRKLLIQDFACILLDVKMPIMDGFEVAKMIRQRPRSQKTPVIFVTAVNSAELDMKKGYGLGAVDYLLTPIMPEVLIAKVNVFVDLFEKNLFLQKQTEELNEKSFRLAEQAGELKQLNEELEDRVRERTESLLKSEEKYRTLIANLPDIIFVHVNSIIQYVNESASRITGYSRDEIIGRNIFSFIDENSKQLVIDNIIKRSVDGFSPNYEAVIIGKNGQKIHVIAQGALIDFNGVRANLAVLTDITERKHSEEEILKLNATLELKVKERTEQLARLNEELQAAKAEAERANQAKSEFLSRMSHELRTPMNSILGFAQLMNMVELPPAHKKGVDHILKSGKHLLDLINEVLELSYIESGRLLISLEPVSLQAMIAETLDIIHPLAVARKITVKNESKSNCDRFVTADHQKLKQVLLNLLSNAVKYNTEGGGVKLVCAPGIQKDTVRISVVDTGKGISPEGIQKLFIAFERIGAEVTEVEGTGLGLSVAKKLIEAMNGTIGVESEPGVGSVFWIELPQAESQSDRYQQSGGQTTTEPEKPEVSGRLLYIEDNQSNIELMEQILREQRPSVRLISEKYGKNVIKQATDYAPDLILLDLGLPDIQGNEVLNMLRQNEITKSIPVVVLSADATSKQINNMMKTGAKAYLTKPLDVIKLLTIIDEAMRPHYLPAAGRKFPRGGKLKTPF